MNAGESIEPWNEVLAPRRLVVDRRRQVGPALLLLGCAGALMFEMTYSPLMLKVLVGLIVLVLLVLGAVGVIRPPFIELDDRGITIRRVFGTGFEPWSTCSAFTLSTVGRQEIVSFAPGTFLRTGRRLLNLSRTAAGGALIVPADLDRLRADELVTLLNHYRETGRARPPER